MPAKRKPRKPAPESPGAKLFRTLDELGVSKTAFAESVGRSFVNVYRWRDDIGFGPEQQTLAARALGLPDDYFEVVNAVQRHERRARKVFREFTTAHPELVKALGRDSLAWLESFRFLDSSIQPSVTFYRTVAGVLLGAIAPQAVLATVTENESIARTLADKRTRKR